MGEVDERPFDGAVFRQVLGHFPTGVTVVTAMGPQRPVGMAVGSFFSVSLEPPLVAFCPTTGSDTWRAIETAGQFCVNVLSEDQEHLSRRFASREDDKFAQVGWQPSSMGSPILDGATAWIDCTIEAVHPGGDHVIVVGRVNDLRVVHQAGPLLFYRGGYGRFSV